MSVNLRAHGLIPQLRGPRCGASIWLKRTAWEAASADQIGFRGVQNSSDQDVPVETFCRCAC
jgi:hypothetical protein